MDNALLLTLGHNSSAIFFDGSKTIGYEQERLDRVKGSSKFPCDAINEIVKNVGYDKVFSKDTKVYISHWFDSNYNELILNGDCEVKYIDKKMFNALKERCASINFTNGNLVSHHDAHMYSSLSFMRENIKGKEYKDMYFIVADGFGNDGEVLSIYKQDSPYEKPQQIHRSYNYSRSLGLFYQYATSYCGMSENKDEYKFLGYESHIKKYYDKSFDMSLLVEKVNELSTRLYDELMKKDTKEPRQKGSIINYKHLSTMKSYWWRYFDKLLKFISFDNHDDLFMKRCIIGFFIQSVVEDVLCKIIDSFGIQNVCLSGGLFYNVKLNNTILNHIKGLFSVVPVCGDQGAAIGLYEHFHPGKFIWGNLKWGKRDFYDYGKLSTKHKNVLVLNEKDAIKKIASLLSQNKIVNLVTRNMEFGPRALCSTTTLMLPLQKIVSKNNLLNGRNEVMPCAPIVNDEYLEDHFSQEEYSRVIGSDKFMIVTYNYKHNDVENYNGVMHELPLDEGCYTGRPQIVQDNMLNEILDIINDQCGYSMLVNTSYNVHGVPIVFRLSEAVENFKYQLKNAEINNLEEPFLIIVDHE